MIQSCDTNRCCDVITPDTKEKVKRSFTQILDSGPNERYLFLTPVKHFKLSSVQIRCVVAGTCGRNQPVGQQGPGPLLDPCWALMGPDGPCWALLGPDGP